MMVLISFLVIINPVFIDHNIKTKKIITYLLKIEKGVVGQMDLGFGNTTSFKSEKTKEEENAYKNDDMQEQVDKLKSKNFIGYFIF
jgi:hypothetical protein